MKESYVIFHSSEKIKDSCENITSNNNQKIGIGEYKFYIQSKQQNMSLNHPKDGFLVKIVKLGPLTKLVLRRVEGLVVTVKSYNNPYANRETIIKVDEMFNSFSVNKFVPNKSTENIQSTFNIYQVILLVFILCVCVTYFDSPHN